MYNVVRMSHKLLLKHNPDHELYYDNYYGSHEEVCDGRSQA